MGHAHEFVRRIGEIIRSSDATPDEELPKRWVDLIHYLDEKEQREEDNKRKRTS